MIYLNKHGQIVKKTMKQIKAETGKPISWELMHQITKHKVTNKQEYEYLKKYLGEVSVFTWNNFKQWGYVQLYPHWQEVAIKNGAEDLRNE